MVRVGDWELRLVHSDTKQPFPEVRQQSGARTTYAVAAPGQAFEVQVTQHPNPSAKSQKAHSMHKATLEVDGQDVGFTKILKAIGTTATFRGFPKAGDAETSIYQSFVFSKPQETAAKQAHSLDFEEGKIKCEVCPAERTQRMKSGRHHGPAATNETIAKLPEGKKFFMAPSLTTGKGELKMGKGFGKYRYRTTGPAVAVLKLRYETAATLLLRGVLKPDNPAHAAILAQFDETAAEQQYGDEAAGPSRRRAAPAAAVEVKEEAGGSRDRKRQRRQRQEQQQEEELIDLTKHTNDNDEVLAAKKADKVLECDLTAEDEPAWRAVKKEVHSLM